MKLKRINVLSFARVCGIFGVIGGFFTGLVYFLMGETIKEAVIQAKGPLSPLLDLGAGALLAGPVGYGVASFVVGMIFSGMYNLAAKLVGGIELELEE